MAASNAFTGLVEFTPAFAPRPQISHVLFDFDGTLSLIRGGWADVMTGCFLQWMVLRPDESPQEIGEKLRQEVLALNGKPTVFQMEHFACRLVERGETPRDLDWYNDRFRETLLRKTAERLSAIRQGRAGPEQFLVPGAIAVLRLLQASGATLHLVSGTERRYVLEEAEALGLIEFFENRIHGPEGDDQGFSKMQVMSAIMDRYSVSAGELLSFGDGPVEIQNTRKLEGLAIGIASDENEPASGRTDKVKAGLLLKAGADVVFPDYAMIPALLKRLCEGAKTQTV